MGPPFVGRLGSALLRVMDGDGFGWGGNHLDLKKFGPELSGDEEAVVHGVVGDAVEHGFGIGDLAGLKQAGEIDPAQHAACRGRDAHNAVGVPDVGVDLAVNVFELVELVDRLAVIADVNVPHLAESGGVEETNLRGAVQRIRFLPSAVSPQPSQS